VDEQYKHYMYVISNGVYEFYFVSCMNIIFNELRQQRVGL